jgi:hypothetical protein
VLSLIPWRFVQYLAGIAYIGFQLLIAASGNLSFLNYLTMVPAIYCFDDAFFLALFGRWLRRRWEAAALADAHLDNTEHDVEVYEIHESECQPDGSGSGSGGGGTPQPDVEYEDVVLSQQLQVSYSLPRPHARTTWLQLLVQVAILLVVVYLSIAPVRNLLSDEQVMNQTWDSWHLVNSYGAFGSVDPQRSEVIVFGTNDVEPTADTEWLEYQFPCKPGDVTKVGCMASPYHYRLSWHLWYVCLSDCSNTCKRSQAGGASIS